MKLLRIEVENLNSLYGSHTVDFEGDLGGAPLVLIAGPTGAGKSTLLDAVGLALFGRTPRLTSPRSDDAALDARSILSRGAGEGSAAVEFRKRESGQAVRYRATWSCKRARNRPDGALQDPVRRLERFDPDTGRVAILASDSRARFFKAEFDRVLEGLSVADFQRSVLLAQGEFAAFLKADVDERVSLLERLTATERFREIGERAAKARAGAQQSLEAVDLELASLQLLSDADRKALGEEAARLGEEARRAREEVRRIGACLEWLSQKAEHQRRRDEQAQSALEARDALAARSEDFARLAEHERCASAAAALRALESAAEEAARADGEVARLESDAREKSEVFALADRTAREAASARAGAEEALSSAAGAIAGAREVRTLLAAAAAELEAAGAERRRALESAFDLESKGRGARARRDEQAERLRRAQTAVAELSASRPLVGLLAGFEARFGALREREREFESRRKQRDARAKGVVEASGNVNRAQALQARSREEDHLSTKQLEEAAAALTAALGGAPDARTGRQALARELEASAELARSLEALMEVERQRAERAQRGEVLAGELRAAQGALRSIEERGPGLASERRAQDEELAQVAQELEDLSFMAGLARERGRLRSGEPCPLCGSESHPFLEDARLAQVDERTGRRTELLDGRRQELVARGQRLQAELEDAAVKAAELKARLDSEGRELEALRAELGAAEKRLRAGLGALGLCEAAELAPRSGALARAKEDLERGARELEDAEALWLSRKTARQEAAAALERQEQAARAAAAELELRSSTLREAEDEVARLGGQLEADRESLASQLQAHGIGADRADLGALRAAIAKARSRAEEVQSADESLAAARDALAVADGSALEADARAQAAADRLVALEKALGARAAEVEGLKERASTFLAGEDPELVEDRLKREIERAGRASAEADGARASLDAALAAARGRLESEAKRREELARAVDERRASLGAALSALGLGGEAELRLRLLSADDQAALASAREALERAARATAELLAAREKDLAELEARRPAPLAPDAEAPPLLEAMQEQERQVAELERALHGAQARQEEDAARRALHAKKAGRRDGLRGELEVWERLHGLIGVRDGQQFQRFAQILNLEELVRKANGRLARIAPRYQLSPARDARGDALLAFAVRDEWLGGAERPVTTLSGGESFLVSLALALALADYRAVRMPIETLLLDEGFGALDRETLSVAMNALSALTSEGVQVALISHVEWLRDQIEAQVTVEPRGNGRSRVVVSVAGKVINPAVAAG